MAFTGIVIKLFTTFLPLIKEYITSSDKRKDILSLRTMTTWVIVTLMVGTGCTLYLSEQAINNLTIHEPIIKQYNKVHQENVKLLAEQELLKKAMRTCKEETATALSICTIKDTPTPSTAQEYVYDPKSHTMVLLGEIKK